ncbi:MAG: nitrile hydratase accessory protein [Gammaproteobacteria bacterium]|nr:nitrile hydratase accessory protein [Gammaproteobacteria bacterium]
MTMELSGKEAPPMANGELIFEAPWESRVFGMARLLCEKGYYQWDDFRACLINEIEHWEAGQIRSAAEVDYPYYVLFHKALEKLLSARNICQLDELLARSEALMQRPHGHDH